MDTTIAMTRLAAAIEHQVLVASGDEEMEALAELVRSSLEPVVRQIALDLAEQAAAEIAAQLAGYEVDVVLSDGEPALKVRREQQTGEIGAESLDARITLRLPPALKERVESEADHVGESVNSWLVKTLAAQAGARQHRRGRRITGIIET